MCVELRTPDGEYLETLGELRGYLVPKPVRFHANHDQDPESHVDGECLRPVDLAATFGPIGFEVVWDEAYMTGQITPIEGATQR